MELCYENWLSKLLVFRFSSVTFPKLTLQEEDDGTCENLMRNSSSNVDLDSYFVMGTLDEERRRAKSIRLKEMAGGKELAGGFVLPSASAELTKIYQHRTKPKELSVMPGSVLKG